MAKTKKLTSKKVGETLRTLRQKKGWSLRYLGERTKLSHESIRLIEHGRGSASAVLRIMAELKVPAKQRAGWAWTFVAV